jgi:hypothetical protein
MLAAWPAGAHSGAAGRAQCTGFAPTTTFCYDGPHDAFFTYSVLPDQPATKQGILIYANYTGSIESRLVWPAVNPSQSWFIRCDVKNNDVVGTCASGGTPPPPTVKFLHRCYSWVIGSPTLGGGTGNWGCYVDHDASPVPGPAVGDSRHLSLKLVGNGSETGR